MRVIIAHNHYRSSQLSGENIAVTREVTALRRAGVEVVELDRKSDDALAASAWSRLHLGLALAGSAPRRRALVRELAALGGDVLHIHNLFPMFGTDLWEAAQKLKLPVVQTIHNHRLLATATHLLGPWGARTPVDADEQLHLARLSPLHGGRVIDWLYRRGLTRCWQRGLPARCVTAWIVHSPFHRDLLIAVGIPRERIVIRLHTLEQAVAQGDGPGDHALFVGRLKAEKGVDLLAAQWPTELPLAIVGDGPEIAIAQRLAGSRFRGALPSQAVAEEMAKARFLVVASRVYEGGGLPLVALEALAAGTPVLAPAIGALPALIAERGVGWCYDPSVAGALTAAARRAWVAAPTLRAHCRTVVARDHDAQASLSRLRATYAAIAAGKLPEVAA